MCRPVKLCSGADEEKTALRISGFSVVELITVIMLLGILSAVAMSRFTGADAFAPKTIAYEVIAQTRLAQQVASSRQDAVVSILVDQVAEEWRFQILSDVDGIIHSELVDRANTSMLATNGVLVRSISATEALTITFDGFGDLSGLSLGVTSGTPAEGLLLQIAGDTALSVCVYPNGYAANGPCV